ncbi:hypothetical protein EJB05_21993, partial [Eragrostis curvula]
MEAGINGDTPPRTSSPPPRPTGMKAGMDGDSARDHNFRFKKTHSKGKCLIPLELLKSSDFLFDDTCVFGVTILKADVSSPKRKSAAFPKEPSTRVQNLFLQKKEFIKGAYTWAVNISTWSKLEIRFPMFEVGGHKWHINMYPLGNEHSTKSLSLFLYLHDPSELPLDSG